MENSWNSLIEQVAQRVEFVARCTECEELKAAKCIILIDGQWSFLCEECFEKNYVVRLANGTGFDLTTVEAKVNGRYTK